MAARRPIDNFGRAYCPIIHAADDETVLQNIAALPFIAEAIAGHTLRDRLGAVPNPKAVARGRGSPLVRGGLAIISRLFGRDPLDWHGGFV